MRAARIKTPTPLSSIFSPKVLEGGRPRTDPDRLGARGGGFSFFPGVDTEVEVVEDGEGVVVEVNGAAASFPPAERAVELARRAYGLSGRVFVRHKIYVPIATGFGTSAASALSVILALSHLAGRPSTLREAVKLTHRVELECKTGLNSEAGFGRTGLVLVLREGGPDYSLTDEIPLPARSKLVAVVAGQMPTPDTIASTERLVRLEEVGDMFIDKIVQNPTPDNFLTQSRAFAERAGLASQDVREVFKAMEKLPTIGFAQNMVGRAVHALVYEEDVEKVVSVLSKQFKQYRLIVGEVGSTITLNTLKDS
ncbi:MAG: hypothetical protein QXV27_04900 [Candidatus Caldarchaeum sp.]